MIIFGYESYLEELLRKTVKEKKTFKVRGYGRGGRVA